VPVEVDCNGQAGTGFGQGFHGDVDGGADGSVNAQGGGLAYLRVADDIARIRSGELAPGTKLRPERELTEIYGVAYGTIRLDGAPHLPGSV
jgi:Bacterial regulatory proteins, gntR family